MKKKIVVSTLICALLCNGCVNHISDESDKIEKRAIVFHTGLSIDQKPMRSVSADISKLIVADYQGGVEKQKIEQSSSDVDFGTVLINLDFGKHEILFVGHSSEKVILSYPTISFDKITDTFSYYLSVDVDKSSSDTQNINMNRSIGLIKIVAEDAVPSTISSLKIMLSKYHSVLNMKTSLAEGLPEAFERTFEYKQGHIGMETTTYSIYTFIPENGFTTDIYISSLDEKGNIVNTIEVKNISVEKNRQTILSGNIFHSDINTNITVSNKWDEDIEVPI